MEWVRRGHFTADREPIDFETWRYLVDVYAAVPHDPSGLDLVVMKSAQGGASIFSLLLALNLSLRGRYQLAYFLPTQAHARVFSQDRFLQLVRNNPSIHNLMGDPGDPQQRSTVDEGSAFSRRLLHSILYFTHTSGKVSTEALPLDAILFDEVQEMSLSDIERARERIAASPLRMTVAVSTANFFGADIHALYMESDQREFFTRCQCPNGFVMAEAWDPRSGPLCIGHGNGSTPGVPLGYFYRCPRCDFVVNDPQNGEFCARQPGSRRIGFHFPQMLSPRQSAADIVEKWDRRVNTKNFYNRILGVPYSDPDTQPVTEELLRAAQNSDIVWPVHGTVPRREDYDGIYAGIDQHGGNNYIVIAGRPRGSSRMRLLHLEVIESNDPFSRLHELMRQFRVRYAAIESLPNYNEAFGFAKAFPDRVFVVTYLDLDDDLVLWGDRVKETLSDRRTDDEAKLRCSAKVDQFKMMSWALSRWVKGEVETPKRGSFTKPCGPERGFGRSRSVRMSSGVTSGTSRSSPSFARVVRTNAGCVRRSRRSAATTPISLTRGC